MQVVAYESAGSPKPEVSPEAIQVRLFHKQNGPISFQEITLKEEQILFPPRSNGIRLAPSLWKKGTLTKPAAEQA